MTKYQRYLCQVCVCVWFLLHRRSSRSLWFGLRRFYGHITYHFILTWLLVVRDMTGVDYQARVTLYEDVFIVVLNASSTCVCLFVLVGRSFCCGVEVAPISILFKTRIACCYEYLFPAVGRSLRSTASVCQHNHIYCLLAYYCVTFLKYSGQ